MSRGQRLKDEDHEDVTGSRPSLSGLRSQPGTDVVQHTCGRALALTAHEAFDDLTGLALDREKWRRRGSRRSSS